MVSMKMRRTCSCQTPTMVGMRQKMLATAWQEIHGRWRSSMLLSGGRAKLMSLAPPRTSILPLQSHQSLETPSSILHHKQAPIVSHLVSGHSSYLQPPHRRLNTRSRIRDLLRDPGRHVSHARILQSWNLGQQYLLRQIRKVGVVRLNCWTAGCSPP